ncbi:MAG TPA: hypothetical protein P5013_06610 [Methanoregula sp.]|nr:hypothetical protein [Methanoregula sp.]
MPIDCWRLFRIFRTDAGIPCRSVKIERLLPGRRFTALSVTEAQSVLVTEVMTIGQAHKKYNLN